MNARSVPQSRFRGSTSLELKLEGAAYGLCDFKIPVGPNYSLDDLGVRTARRWFALASAAVGVAGALAWTVDRAIFDPNDPQSGAD